MPILKGHSTNQLIALIRNHHLLQDSKIKNVRTEISHYLEHHKVNGYHLSLTPRKEFSDNIVLFYKNKTKLRGPSNKCWDRFKQYAESSSNKTVDVQIPSVKISINDLSLVHSQNSIKTKNKSRKIRGKSQDSSDFDYDEEGWTQLRKNVERN